MTAEPVPGEALVIRPLRRVEFERLVDGGAFVDEKLELLDGRLVEMNPRRSIHAWTVYEIESRLKETLGRRLQVRVQGPLALDDLSEPEPDIAVVPPGDDQDQHPTSALLLIEVAETSLHKDRMVKGPLYARAGVPEYWIVNLHDRVVEQHDLPAGGRYSRVTPVPFTDMITSLEIPEVCLRLADFIR